MSSVEDLFAVLRGRNDVKLTELVEQIASRKVIFRLLRDAGDRVCRMGRTRGARYALARSIPGVGTRIPVYRVDETGSFRQIGVLRPLAANDSCWLEMEDGTGRLFYGLPPFGHDMPPQGYLGRTFPERFPELGLPSRVSDWNNDQRLIALARRGEDLIGDIILGTESLDRFLQLAPESVLRRDYPDIATGVSSIQPGLSPGGERPKFAVFSEGRHLLVKFAMGDDSAASGRWRDLLVCESVALDTIRAAGVPSAAGEWFDIEDGRFLEMERFDRVGAAGRKGVATLAAIDNLHYGQCDSWTKAALRLSSGPSCSVEPSDIRRVRWLDAFGALIGNTDRHFGNLTFYVDDAAYPSSLQLAPVYDMLPMVFAPEGSNVVDRQFAPDPPTANTHDVWLDAAHCAMSYWCRLAELPELSVAFREKIVTRCRDEVKSLIGRWSATLR